MQYIAPLANLIEHFRALPGIGQKTAVRLAYHVLDMDAAAAKSLAGAIREAKEKIGYCNTCFNLSDRNPCAICADPERRRDIVCVVRDARDVNALERMRDYNGLYHVLGGVISPMDGVGPDDIRIRELLSRLASGEIKEVVLATNPDVEGEATAAYISRLIKPMGVKVTRIAHGVPVGGELEYTDEVTLLRAFEGRTTL